MELVDVLDAGLSKFADSKGVYQKQARWVCKIVKVIDTEASDPESLIGSEVWKWTTMGMGPRGNMRKFTEAFANRTLEDDEQADVEEIIGKYAKVHLAQKQGENGVEIHWTMTPYVSERRAGKPKPAAAPTPPPAADDDDEWPDDDSGETPF